MSIPSAPPGWPTVIPRIVATDAARLVKFIHDVFGATGQYEEQRPTEVWIGSSVLLISEAGIRDAMPAFLYVYVHDVDGAYHRAVGAGATTLEAPSLMPYGDRRCMVEDAWGNTWQIAAYRGAGA